MAKTDSNSINKKGSLTYIFTVLAGAVAFLVCITSLTNVKIKTLIHLNIFHKCSGFYYIEYTLRNPGESERHLFSVLGVANNGWYNRLYTLTGQVGVRWAVVYLTYFYLSRYLCFKRVCVLSSGLNFLPDYNALFIVCWRGCRKIWFKNWKGELQVVQFSYLADTTSYKTLYVLSYRLQLLKLRCNFSVWSLSKVSSMLMSAEEQNWHVLLKLRIY